MDKNERKAISELSTSVANGVVAAAQQFATIEDWHADILRHATRLQVTVIPPDGPGVRALWDSIKAAGPDAVFWPVGD